MNLRLSQKNTHLDTFLNKLYSSFTSFLPLSKLVNKLGYQKEISQSCNALTLYPRNENLILYPSIESSAKASFDTWWIKNCPISFSGPKCIKRAARRKCSTPWLHWWNTHQYYWKISRAFGGQKITKKIFWKKNYVPVYINLQQLSINYHKSRFIHDH